MRACQTRLTSNEGEGTGSGRLTISRDNSGIVPLSDRSIYLSNSRNRMVCDRRMILEVAPGSSVFVLRLLEDALQRSHEQRLLGFETGLDAAPCEACATA